MNLEPTTHRFVAVFNRKIEQGKLMNELGQMSAGLTSFFQDASDLRIQTYSDKDNSNIINPCQKSQKKK